MYLVPNSKIGKKGLRGGEISTGKDEYKKLSEVEIKILEKNIPGLKLKGTLVDNKPDVTEKTANSKSDNRIALEKEAIELEIEFTDRTSGKDLQSLIADKKAELES